VDRNYKGSQENTSKIKYYQLKVDSFARLKEKNQPQIRRLLKFIKNLRICGNFLKK